MDVAAVKLHDELGHAIDRCDVKKVCRIVDHLRLRGMTYSQIYAVVQRIRPDMDEAAWDALLFDGEPEE